MLAHVAPWFTYVFCLLGTTLLCGILNCSYHFYDWYYSGPPASHRYEYIVVGTGTAGSIVASGIPSSAGSVLVVEAGSMRSALMDVPLLQPVLQGTHYNWRYLTEPQEHACRAMNDHRSHWPMGRVFGGTHMLNNMIYGRTGRDDFAGWFASDEALDEFMRYFEEGWGKDATIWTETAYGTELSGSFGCGGEGDTCGSSLGGEFRRPDVTVRNGRRWTTSHHYWEHRGKEHELLLNAKVLSIKIEDGKAVGVVLEKSGKRYEIAASEGIILAAGTVGSAKILLQSGIGPREHLELVGISPVVDLPVGEHLQDHLTTGMDLVLLSKQLPLQPLDLIHPVNLWNFAFSEETKSSLSLTGCEYFGYLEAPSLRSNFSKNIAYMMIPMGISSDAGVYFHDIVNLRPDVWNKYYKPLADRSMQAISILPILLHPKSEGYIRLRDNNPHSEPLIQPNYLHHQDDVDTLVTGITLMVDLLLQEMDTLGAELNPMPFPGCERHVFASKPYWECYVRSLSSTMYHPVGTCRMGSKNDRDSVVSNADFSVHGVANLHVVDGSVMRNALSIPPNSAIVALAHHFLKVKFNVSLLQD